MDIMDIIQKSGGIESMARELGVDQNVAMAGAGALLPAILGGFKKNAQSQSSGLEGLFGMIGGMGGGGLLDNVLGSQPTSIDQGNNVLGEIFGSKDVSRSVAGNASEQTGIDSSMLKKMLPMVAMMVAGYMAKQGGQDGGQSSGGGIGGMLGGVLGGLMGGGGSNNASGGGLLGSLGNMLDLDGDGNPLDDIIGMASKFTK